MDGTGIEVDAPDAFVRPEANPIDRTGLIIDPSDVAVAIERPV
jgi:hypothetical protein